MSYEKKIRKTLENEYRHDFNYHHWFAFRRTLDGKTEYCEPEMFLRFKDFVLLLECKRTGSPLGRDQMVEFYAPILARVYARPVRCLQICKNVAPYTPGPFVQGLEKFIQSGLTYATWHNLGT